MILFLIIKVFKLKKIKSFKKILKEAKYPIKIQIIKLLKIASTLTRLFKCKIYKEKCKNKGEKIFVIKFL